MRGWGLKSHPRAHLWGERGGLGGWLDGDVCRMKRPRRERHGHVSVAAAAAERPTDARADKSRLKHSFPKPRGDGLMTVVRYSQTLTLTFATIDWQ